MNTLVARWLSSIQNGDYKAYKSVVASPFRMDLNEFTQKTSRGSGVNSLVINTTNEYVIASLNNFINNVNSDKLSEIKSSNLSSTAIEMKIIVTIGSRVKTGIVLFVKQNGIWKIVALRFDGGVKYDAEKYKAINVISKNPPSVCDCVDAVVNGNSYLAHKCYFYYKSFKNEKEKMEDELFKCIDENNYCDYVIQIKQMYELNNKINSLLSLKPYSLKKENQIKLDKLKQNCE